MKSHFPDWATMPAVTDNFSRRGNREEMSKLISGGDKDAGQKSSVLIVTHCLSLSTTSRYNKLCKVTLRAFKVELSLLYRRGGL